jgi:hypothetical protein
MKLPSISPVMNAIGHTIQMDGTNAVLNPVLPPPVPLIPPSLFGTHPSLPELRNPLNADLYWNRSRGIAGGDYIRGSGLNSILYGSPDLMDKDKLKKTLYRNDLLN